ncbi:MaoC family dehydratase [Georgenia sp. 10Sc9-8]|uniref:MaoC family dehydratase n=1 Tax=Georgenia halotolerans TaxID=3028317 RepID=A0ABT5TYT7_9MICO|nr:MaoC family dehydratase [Georgenia halotolerans]
MSEQTALAGSEKKLLAGHYYEDLSVGDKFGGYVVTVTEGMISAACGLFLDIAALHRDKEAAREAGFDSLIAPGTLTAGLVIAPIALVAGDASATHLEDHVKFRGPVLAGDTLDVTLEVTRMEPKSNFGLVEFTIHAVNGERRLVAEVVTLMGHKYKAGTPSAT